MPGRDGGTADPRFDAFTRLAARLFSVPVALVTVLDGERQRFRSAVGFTRADETSRGTAFCSHAVLNQGAPMVVEDARLDPRFADNPLVTGPHRIRFYAGVPVLDADGTAAGTLCILDTEPRRLSHTEIETLCDLAYGVSSVLGMQQAAAGRQESEENHRWAVALSPQSHWISDPAGNIIEVGSQLLEQLGASLREVRGLGWVKGVPPEDLPMVERRWKRSLRTGERLDVEFHLRMADGSLRWVRSRAAPRRDAAGQIVRWYGTIEDIDERKRMGLAAAETHRRLRTVLESTTDLVVFYDHDWRATYLNPGVKEYPGFAGLLGQVLWEAFPDLVGSRLETELRRAAAQQVPVVFEWFSRRMEGWIEIHAHPTPQGVSVFMRDVTEQHRLRVRLMHQALHDPVTQLPNRTFLQEELERRLLHPPGPVLLRLCLVGYRPATDVFGPTVAAPLLREIADRLRNLARTGHFLARLEGAEFALLHSAGDGEAEAEALAAQVVAVMQEPFRAQGNTIALKPVVGLAFAADALGDSGDRLLQAAEIAMSRVRVDGQEGVQRFTVAMQRELEGRHQLMLDLQAAVGRDELFLVYQPLVDFPQRRVGGFEALMRWRHPRRGIVSPAEFIPVAEQGGLMVSLGAWALRRACEDAVRWPAPLRVAVNLSPVQFRDPMLVETVERTLLDTGLPAGRLKLEITETVLLEDSEANLGVLHRLRALGVLIVLDDFGTGYSSLSYLQRFPFHKLKIDQSFIRPLIERAENQAIVRSILDLARALGIDTTAEGVETEAQLAWLVREGCGQVQGFLLGRPMPVSEVEGFLHRFQQRPPGDVRDGADILVER